MSSSAFIGANLTRIGRKNSILLGYITITLASTCFGLLSLIDNDIVFFVLAMVLRFIQGLADASVTVAVYSVVTMEFPEKRE